MSFNDFDKRFKSHQRSMTIFNRVFWIMFVVVSLVILTVWGFVGYTTYSAIKDPSLIGRTIGEVVRGFNEVQK